jgi:hypothetical protein
LATTDGSIDNMTTDAIERIAKLQRDQAERERRIVEVRRSLELLHEPGSVFEIRALHVGRVKSVSGYFDNYDSAATAACDVDKRKAVGVYVTLNPCNPALLSRANNRMVDWPKATTTDAEIIRRRWLFIDIDPTRPSGIGSTDDEKQTAKTLAADIEEILRGRGWPFPLLVDSGNGCYLLYRVDLPNDDETTALLKRFYAGLNGLLGTYDPSKPHSKLDLSVFNAARILRIGGTLNRKGDSTQDRPHRPCVYHEPDPDCPVNVVPIERINDVAELAKKETTDSSKPSHNGNGRSHHSNRFEFRRLDVPRYLDHFRVAFKTKEVDGGTAFLVQCPHDQNHGGNGETAVYQADDGQLTFECKHNSCSGRRWSDFREAIGLPLSEHYEGGPNRRNGRQTHADRKQDSADQQDDPDRPDEKPEAEKPRFCNVVDSAALLAMDLRSSFAVKRVLVSGQPCVVGGRSKTLKTSITADMVISLGTGTPFLGEFETQRQRVLFMSSESGVSAIRETAVRIAKAKQVQLADASILWGFSVPQLSRHDHLQALADLIAERSLDVIVVDPLYLALLTPELANAAGNLFAMGAALGPLSEIGQQTGATIVVLHHFRKSGMVDQDEPAGLDELAQAGVAEWARQWVLLQRRQPYQADGEHKLWMRCGGSAGHAGLYAVDVVEGIYDPDQADSRRWDVDVRSTTDAREEINREKESRKAREQERREQDDRRKVTEAMRRISDGDTITGISKLAGLAKDRTALAIRCLLGDGLAEMIDIKKHTRTEQGYRLKQG